MRIEPTRAPRGRPQRITSVTAKHRTNGAVEHYRSRDVRASRETVVARFGHFLASLGWRPQDILITNVCTEKEDHTTMAVRNRLIEPRA
jgi:hypothetical protein